MPTYDVVYYANDILAKNTQNLIELVKAGGAKPTSSSSSRKNKTAGEIIGEEKQGGINREFPNEWRDSTLKEIEDAAKQGDTSARKAKKLLNDRRFDKGDNRK